MMSTPYGYRFDPSTNTTVPFEPEQRVIAKVRELRAAGFSLRAVSKMLADAGLPARTGRSFAPTQIARMVDDAPPVSRAALADEVRRLADEVRALALAIAPLALAIAPRVGRIKPEQREDSDHGAFSAVLAAWPVGASYRAAELTGEHASAPAALRSAVVDAVPKPDAQKVGIYLAQHRDRVVDGRRLVRRKNRTGVSEFTVRAVSPAP
jgi:hypothetical protein